MEIVDKFVHLKRDEDRDLVQWYLTLKTYRTEEASAEDIHTRMKAKFDQGRRDELMKLADALWESFIDRHNDIWHDRFVKVANEYEAYTRLFDAAPPAWMWDLDVRTLGRVQYANVHFGHRLSIQAQYRHEAVIDIATKRGIDLAEIGYQAPELYQPDIERLKADRREAERERKRAYRAKKVGDTAKAKEVVEAIPAETTDGSLRVKLAAAYATIESRDRQIAQLKSEAHLLPIKKDAAAKAATEAASEFKRMWSMEAEIADLKEQLEEANERARTAFRYAQERQQTMEAEITRLRAEIARRDSVSSLVSVRVRNPISSTRSN
ncbi:MAG: hypothetical protein IKE60_26295 [Reyranella sp.]|uniref:hypothetical protein n=1 Tax=Reyranella sp. TaxID=1929291 RepID=UPI0025DB7C60|nr:hypothetical protein [Reyranella sp.]MBR2818200.1 hypothetical protein [Reyranella sp.]